MSKCRRKKKARSLTRKAKLKRASACMTLRGTWLRDVGFSEGTPMAIVHQGHQIILTAQGSPGVIAPGTPTTLEREIRLATVDQCRGSTPSRTRCH